jgi:uncharacterized membrane protein YgcG
LRAICALLFLWAGRAGAASVIAAYQEAYGMNFEVWRPEGLPAGWFATFDGYPVAQVSENHWVYGVQRGRGLAPADIAVGSVVPMDVPALARVAVSLWRSGAYETKAFRSVAYSGLDNMGVLDEPAIYTPVAWKTGEGEILLWLGNRWERVTPSGGQSTAKAFEARRPLILRTLRAKGAIWTRSDTEELADLAREWGCLWRGSVAFYDLPDYRNGGSGDRDSSEGAESPGSGSSGGGGGGNWDTGGSSPGSPGSSGGGDSGGWDTGGK